jgi:putative nucleotidyltransferase with HDIG domain
MPAFPKSVQQVLQLTADINCSPKELVNVIKHDPIFTMKILKVVNSPFVGLAQQVASIQQASVYLGVNTIKNMALSLAVIGALPRTNKAGFDMNAFWLHSLAVATIAHKLAERLNVEKNRRSDFFSAGLLHDIGKGVFALYLPEAFKEALELARNGIPLYEAETERIGVSHAAIGAAVAKKWDLPSPLCESIAQHHAPLVQPSDLCDCLFVGDQLAKALSVGDSGDAQPPFLPPELEERFGADLSTLSHAIPDLEEELDKSRVFVQA